MKLLHQASPDLLLRLENLELRRECARLQDELAGVRRELVASHADLAAQCVDIDDLLDLASLYALGDRAERLGVPREWPWDRWACHDTRPLTVDQAHVVMRQHRRRCLTGECRIRTTAVQVLRDAGHLAPDSTRPSLASHL
jgi:hypothetical protein